MERPSHRPAALLLAALLTGSAGCATILHGTHTAVTIRSDAPQAEVFVDGEPRGLTPLVTMLDHTVSHQIVVRRGEQAQLHRLESNLEPGWLVLDLFVTSIIGVVVDAVTGAWRGLSQDSVFASFGPGSLLAPALPEAAPGAPRPVPVAPWNGNASQ